MKELIHLDCTLRDGGYYNSWDFDDELVNDYLKSMDEASVDFVELGFRFLENKTFYGPYAFTSDSFLEALDIPSNLKIGVMINGADLISGNNDPNKLIKHLVPKYAHESPVKLVRLACHLKDIPQIIPCTKYLKDRGYLIGFNVMQASELTNNDVESLCKLFNEFPVDVVYFADSMGSMYPNDVINISKEFKKNWDGPIGIHTHDNIGLAMQNTLSAIENGITWIDTTVTGMGRGPGNAKTEEMLIELKESFNKNLDITSTLILLDNHFLPMQKKYLWGKNPFYYLSGKYKIHPTYIQSMLADERFKNDDILSVIKYLKDNGGQTFNSSNLDAAKNFFEASNHYKKAKLWDPDNFINSREVLIIGTGPSSSKYSKAIESYIQKKKPCVIVLNNNNSISSNYISARIACNPFRMVADKDSYISSEEPLIMPESALPDTLRDSFKGKKIFDYALEIIPGKYNYTSSGCILPSPLVFHYALSVCASGNAPRILLAGFDGYEPGNSKNDETAKVIELFKEKYEGDIISVTPTRHKLKSKSIFNHDI